MENKTIELSDEERIEAQKAHTKRTRDNFALFVEMLEDTVANFKPKTAASRRVLMLKKSGLPLAIDKESGEIVVSQELAPQTFSISKAKRISKNTTTKNEGRPIVVTKLQYYKTRLRLAKGMLELFNKSLEIKAEKPKNSDDYRKEHRELKKVYCELSSEERESGQGETIVARMKVLRTLISGKPCGSNCDQSDYYVGGKCGANGCISPEVHEDEAVINKK